MDVDEEDAGGDATDDRDEDGDVEAQDFLDESDEPKAKKQGKRGRKPKKSSAAEPNKGSQQPEASSHTGRLLVDLEQGYNTTQLLFALCLDDSRKS